MGCRSRSARGRALSRGTAAPCHRARSGGKDFLGVCPRLPRAAFCRAVRDRVRLGALHRSQSLLPDGAPGRRRSGERRFYRDDGRRPGNYGSRQSRRQGRRRPLHRLQYRPARGAKAQRLCRSLGDFSLLFRAQSHVGKILLRIHRSAGRFRHDGRDLRDRDVDSNRKDSRVSPGPNGQRVLGTADRVYVRAYGQGAHHRWRRSRTHHRHRLTGRSGPGDYRRRQTALRPHLWSAVETSLDFRRARVVLGAHENRMSFRLFSFGIGFLSLLLCCAPGLAQPRSVILSTTTSTQDSGLLDVLIPLFEKHSGYAVKTVAVGTGQALALAERGDADVVLAHAPTLEKDSVAKGKLLNRRLVMYNDFIIVGPKDDPAKIGVTKSAAAALRAIEQAKATFVSRGDKSGTQNMELGLWKLARVAPAPPWYIESGQGMGATLSI